MIKERPINSEVDLEFNPFHTYEAINERSYIKAEYSRPLQGEVQVSGTKNMVSKVIAASLSANDGRVRIRNIPFVGDLAITLALCRRLGVDYRIDSGNKELELTVGNFTNPDVISDPYHGNRVAILFAGPVLAKLGRANISKPEGCQIGERKIDYHLEGLKALGVDIVDKGDYYSLSLRKHTLEGTRYNLPFPSVGATENFLIAASCAEGESVLVNCALEPEIVELVKILQRSGVSINILPDRTLKIRGKRHGITPLIDITPDRVEAASLAIAGLSSQGDVFVKDAQHETLISFLGILQEMKAGFDIQNDGIRFYWREPLKAVDVTTEVYPSFPTDFQQPMAVLMSQAEGKSSIHETIFEDRFRYLEQLNKIANSVNPTYTSTICPTGQACRFKDAGYKHVAYINGQTNFIAGNIEITDMRAGFAMVNAALLSSGGVVVRNLKSLYRGYENPVDKLKSLGAKIELVI